jgi:succinate dehydrogenase / fumarate reductase flavoprotein subunit
VADGYFIAPLTVGNYLADLPRDPVTNDHPAFADTENEVRDRANRLLAVNGNKTVDEFHIELGKVMWENCAMERNEAGLKEALSVIPEIRERFWTEVRVPGSGDTLNQSLEKAGRVADFLEFAEIMCWDALRRDESCGAHYRTEHTTEEGEAKRDDTHFSFVSVWEFKGVGEEPALHREPLEFHYVPLSTRSYK